MKQSSTLNLALIQILAATMGGPMMMNSRRSSSPVSYVAKLPNNEPSEASQERLDAAQAKRERKAKARAKQAKGGVR